MLMDGATSSMPISIHAPRVGSDLLRRLELGGARISIHAPRVGSDPVPLPYHVVRVDISIHAPRVGSDLPLRRQAARTEGFLSTLPAWGATSAPQFPASGC